MPQVPLDPLQFVVQFRQVIIRSGRDQFLSAWLAALIAQGTSLSRETLAGAPGEIKAYAAQYRTLQIVSKI